jgi:hypothetical protein
MAVASLHVPLQKLAVKITPDGVIDEPFWCLCLSSCLVLEYHIVIPTKSASPQASAYITQQADYTRMLPSLHTEGARFVDVDQRIPPHQFSFLHLCLSSACSRSCNRTYSHIYKLNDYHLEGLEPRIHDRDAKVTDLSELFLSSLFLNPLKLCIRASVSSSSSLSSSSLDTICHSMCKRDQT